MPRIKPVNPEKVDSKTANALTDVRSKLGMLPNLFTTIANSPVSLDAYLKLMAVLSGGRLSNKQRELIAIAVAQENSCEYCLSAHSAIGAGLGLDEKDIEQARDGGAINPVDDAIVDFALKVVHSRGSVRDEELEHIRTACGDDGVVIEVVANVVLNIMTNYINRLAGTEVDFPVVSLDSVA